MHGDRARVHRDVGSIVRSPGRPVRATIHGNPTATSSSGDPRKRISLPRSTAAHHSMVAEPSANRIVKRSIPHRFRQTRSPPIYASKRSTYRSYGPWYARIAPTPTCPQESSRLPSNPSPSWPTTVFRHASNTNRGLASVRNGRRWLDTSNPFAAALFRVWQDS